VIGSWIAKLRSREDKMERRIRIHIGQETFQAELNDSRTAQAIWEALPFESRGSLWGKEIYFTIPVKMEEDAAVEVVDPGTLAYWPVGSAFCIFWGPTPVSRAAECRAYSPVNVFGRITDELEALDRIADVSVSVERVE
jgi:hypothetical protein